MKIPVAEWQASLLPALNADDIALEWHSAAREIARLTPKILVLDDDPTGTQTVAGVPVWTRWDEETLISALSEESRVVFLLTNSRALSAEQSRALHEEMSHNLRRALSRSGAAVPIIISRGDSTLRGHYPLETQVLREELFQNRLDGEILIPFFAAGGRVTSGDVHYVREGGFLVPAGETEFARDPHFGYGSSDLRAWIEEKSGGATRAQDVVSVSLQALRGRDVAAIAARLGAVRDFGKVIVNAVSETDLQVFVVALSRAMARGKRFLFRSAASWVPILAGMPPAAPFVPDAVPDAAVFAAKGPGLLVVGSWVGKTTRQLHALHAGAPELARVELDAARVQDAGQSGAEIERAAREIAAHWRRGQAVCLFSSREYRGQTPDASARVAAALISVVSGALRNAPRPPAWIVAKGGITSSDIATRALNAVRALVLGPIVPGVPVWRLGKESALPGGIYVVFPGNVGDESALLDVYRAMASAAASAATKNTATGSATDLVADSVAGPRAAVGEES